MGRWSALNHGGTWQQEVGGGGGGWEEERGGRKSAWENELYQDDVDDNDGADEYSGVRGLTTKSVMLEVARQVLRLLHQHRQQERRMGRQVVTSAIARDTVRLIVMGLMGTPSPFFNIHLTNFRALQSISIPQQHDSHHPYHYMPRQHPPLNTSSPN